MTKHPSSSQPGLFFWAELADNRFWHVVAQAPGGPATGKTDLKMTTSILNIYNLLWVKPLISHQTARNQAIIRQTIHNEDYLSRFRHT